jgi:hypothetical protein
MCYVSVAYHLFNDFSTVKLKSNGRNANDSLKYEKEAVMINVKKLCPTFPWKKCGKSRNPVRITTQSGQDRTSDF